MPEPQERPIVRLKPRAHKRVLQGHPWVYSNEIAMDEAARGLPPGVVVRLESSEGRALGTAVFNRLPLIAARLLSRDPGLVVDAAFFAQRLSRALAIRERLIPVPYYRLAHAEADGLPGTVIDRFGEALVLQINTAGMERLLPELSAALEEVLAPRAVLLRNDGATRQLEGLETYVRLAKGSLEGPLELVENGARFLADPQGGQKTGWFFDQRDNRAWIARLAAGARVFDGYSFGGGFTVQAALGGATEVVAVDRSQTALDLAQAAAALNGVDGRCRFVKAEVFGQMERMAKAGESFDLVIVDPPAFVKTKKDLWQGIKGYRKMVRLAAQLVRRDGYLFAASCSHHVPPPLFAEQVRRGLDDAGRNGRVLLSAGAALDHPVHPALPETAYLKAQVVALD